MNWVCIKCHREVPLESGEPNVDSFGIYFICPYCRRRNQLESLGHQRGALVLRQTGK